MNDKILKSYKKLVIKKYGYLNFTPDTTDQGKNSKNLLKVPLKDIVIPLDFTIFPNEDKANHIIKFSEMMESSKDRIILGDPGCGKTTFLTHTLINKIEKDGIIPVFWEWREFYRRIKKDSDLISILAKYLKRILRNNYTDKAIKTFVREYKFVFLIDGIDEAASQKCLPIMKSLIQANKEKQPGNYFILSSRIANYPDEYLNLFSGIGFQHYKIKPVNEIYLVLQYINKFISYQVPDDEIKRTDKIEFLSRYIETQAGVQQLAEHPLLLNLIVLIYISDGTLPNTKVNLYQRCIEVLIYAWKKSPRDIRIFRQFHLDNAAIFVLLSEIAFEYFEKFIEGKTERYGVLPRDELQRTLKRIYGNLVRRGVKKSEVNAAVKRLFKYFKEKAGLIVEYSTGYFGFFHLTLFEYLAAAHAVAKYDNFDSNLEFIIKLLNNPNFSTIKEVIIFQVELLGKSTSRHRFIDSLADKLLSTYKKTKKYNILILLAKLLVENQDFSMRDTKEILNLILIYWFSHPGNNEITGLINNILLMSENSRTYLIKSLGQARKERDIWENFSMSTAHRIGKKVFRIKGNLNILEKEVEKIKHIAHSETMEQKIEVIKDQVESLNIIIEEYRKFSSGINFNLREYNIDVLMIEIQETLKKSYPNIEINYSSHEEKQTVMIDKSLMGQVIEELIDNSMQHGKVSDVKISIALEHLGNTFIINFKDNGKGVPGRIKGKIFEPFFSTDSKSMGLGLSTVKKIVESLDGEVEELGRENQGAHFVLKFNHLQER